MSRRLENIAAFHTTIHAHGCATRDRALPQEDDSKKIDKAVPSGFIVPNNTYIVTYGKPNTTISHGFVRSLYQIFKRYGLPTVTQLRGAAIPCFVIAKGRSKYSVVYPTIYGPGETIPYKFHIKNLDISNRDDQLSLQQCDRDRHELSWRYSRHILMPCKQDQSITLKKFIAQNQGTQSILPQSSMRPTVIHYLACQSISGKESEKVRIHAANEPRIDDFQWSCLPRSDYTLLDATRDNNIEAAQELIQKHRTTSEYVNRQYGAGSITALHVAYSRGNALFVQLLKQNGASEWIPDKLGRYPKSYQSKADHASQANKENHAPKVTLVCYQRTR